MDLTEKEIHKIYIEAGLVPCGKNTDGEEEYIGTRKQWEKADQLLFAESVNKNEVQKL